MGRSLTTLIAVLVAFAFAIVPSASAAASPVPGVSIVVPGEVTSGARTVATGRVASVDRRAKVQLQSRHGGRWKPLADGALRRGRFRIAFVLEGAEAFGVRAVLLAGGRTVASSTVRTIKIRSAPAIPMPAPAPPPTPAVQPAPPPVEVPPVAATYWGAWIGPQFTGTAAPEDMSAVTDFEALARKPLSLMESFGAWAECSLTKCPPGQAFPQGALEAMRDHGSIPLYSWASEGRGDTTEQPEFQLADIVAGKFDPYIRQWATEAKAWGHPFFLRFDWEMNGNWFPWSEQVDGNRPGDFVAAWRHVHDIFREVGATNVSWVWCPYVNPNGNLPSDAALYPGDEYVDWTCLDGYNKGTLSSPTAQYRSFDYLFGPDYRAITGTIAPSKPMLLGEVATSEHGGSKAEWIDNMFAELPTAYPQVRGLFWFDYYDQGNDWPIETSTAATEAFATGISAPQYLPNSFGATAGGPVPLPGTVP